MLIQTDRLRLSSLTGADVEDMYKLHSQLEVARYNTIGIPENSEVTRKILAPVLLDQGENKSAYSWKISNKETADFIGEIGISLAPERYKMATVHYSVMPKFWGQGFATEALKSIISYCFDTLNLHRIEAGCAIDNTASIRVLNKVGMQHEGRKRKVLPLQTGWSDNFEFALLKEDYTNS